MVSSPPSGGLLSHETSHKQTSNNSFNERIAKYEAKLAAKAAAGQPNDNHVRKWRGPKGARYFGFGPWHRNVKPKKLRKAFASFTDCPAEIVQKIAAYLGEKEHNALARCNSVFYKWLNQHLYEKNINTGGSSALFWAAANGRLNTIRLMSTFGANLHLATSTHSTQYFEPEDETTGTALHVAVKFGHFDIVNFLIKKGLDLEQAVRSDWCSKTPLEFAIRYNRLNVGLFLIGKGSDVNRKIRHPYTPLQRVLDNFECISFEDQMLWLQMLLQGGADVNFPAPSLYTTGENMESPLALAFWSDKILWAGSNEEPGQTPQKRAPFLVEALLEKGADVHTPIYKGAMPLHLAAMMGWDDIVKYLLEHGAKSDIQAGDWSNQTPLHYAVSISCPRYDFLHQPNLDPWGYGVFSIMDRDTWNQKHGPKRDCNCTGSWDENKDGHLKWKGSIQIVNLLLANGADPDAKRSDGMTPRMLAAQNIDRSFRAALAGGLMGNLSKEKDEDIDKDKVDENGGEDEGGKVKETGDQSAEGHNTAGDPSGDIQNDHGLIVRDSLFGGGSNAGTV